MEGTDVCFAPVLSLAEAPDHPHNKVRKTFVTIDGLIQPAPAPRFSRTVPEINCGPHSPGQDTVSVLADCGFGADEIAALQGKGVVAVI
jgi:alpha-methylacyl-CoA racemase